MRADMTAMAGRKPAPWYELDNPGEYWLGRVVSTDAMPLRSGNLFGHITGFDRSLQREVVVRVMWEDGKEYTIHPGNLTLH